MSQSEEVNRREVAYRLFAAEFEDADFSYAESDEERAPNYVVTPTGARVNRLFVVGVLTEVEQVNEDVVRARVVDPTGAFVIYAGQYQPEALAALESAETPSFVAVTGKARTFQPDDSDVVYTSIRPEEVSEVDADTRDRWVVTTAEQTVDRVATMAAAHQRVERGDRLQQVLESAGVREGLAAGIPLALDHYETTPAYLDAVRTLALDAARVVAGDKEEVGELSLSPSDGGDAPLDFAADLDVPSDAGEVKPMETDPEAGTVDAEFEDDETEVEAGVETESDAEVDEETESAAESGMATESEPDAEPESGAAGEAVEEETPSPEPAAETPSPDEVAADAKPEAESEEAEPETDTESASEADEAAAEPSEAAAGEGEMYEMSEEERQEVEENFDVGFSSGDEIPEAGESDIDVPEAEDEPAADAAETESTAEDELGDFDAGDSGADTEAQDTEDDDESESADEQAEDETSDEFTEDEYDEPESEAEDQNSGSMDLDLEDYVVDLMSELDDGDGARREEVVATATEERDADEGEIEDAIQDALMSGRCYESGDEHLKAI